MQKLKNKGVKIYGIAIKDTEANAIQYLDKQNPYSAVALDETGMIAQLYGVEAPPATFILSKEGVVLYKSAGPLIGDSSTNNFLFQLETALSQ